MSLSSHFFQSQLTSYWTVIYCAHKCIYSPVFVTTATAPPPPCPPPLAWMMWVPQKRVCLRSLSELYFLSPVGSGLFRTGTLSPAHRTDQTSWFLKAWPKRRLKKIWKILHNFIHDHHLQMFGHFQISTRTNVDRKCVAAYWLQSLSGWREKVG